MRVVGGRFELEAEAGEGGMAVVHRARDRETGRTVAVKLLLKQTPEIARRFEDEARALSLLAHPRIVGHVANGMTEHGQLWLAMEWLEGEDLATRLDRGRLPLRDAVAVTLGAAEAMADAHRAGLVHRDLKPSNLFLVDGDPERVKVLDFGIARLVRRGRVATATGMLLGTPGYMAPEQARGERTVDARSDVFSLGCVLFECLTGAPAFSGHDLMAVLAKVCFADAPRVDEVVTGIPPALVELVARMLSRDRDVRPADGTAVLRALGAIGALPAIEGVPVEKPPALSSAEQRRVTVVLAWPRPELDLAEAGTLAAPDADALRDEVSSIASMVGARVELLADGAAVAVFVGLESATDLTARAARCALWMRDRFPEAPIHVATGNAVVGERGLVGDVIDRAVVALAALAHAPVPASGTRPVHLDRAILPLLHRRFEVALGPTGPELLWEWRQTVLPPAGTRRGKCVGRERELATLLATYDECAGEPVARAVLVTGVPGIGKSRLREELALRLADREEAPRTWLVRGDAMTAGSPWALLGQLVRAASGAREAQPPAAQRERIEAYAVERLGPDGGARTAELLAHVAGLGIELPTPAFRAALADAELMRQQVSRAWEEIFLSECALGPRALLLEDLHWGDLGTVQVLDAVLRKLADSALYVVAFARPEVEDTFPRLWSERGLSEIRLTPLSPRAAARLAREVMGAGATDSQVAAVVARAAGHPFVLEELARGAGEGAGGELPDSVLAVLQARFEALTPEARRALRGASLFGERFWTGGVAAVLGATGGAGLDRWLGELALREIVELRPPDETRFTGETELVFRHALVRDAALTTLTEEDRVVGHRLAAAWLEGKGERDPIVLARHLEASGERSRAAELYARAAELSLEEDVRAAGRHAEHALALDPDGAGALAALLVVAEAKFVLGHAEAGDAAAERARSLAERGSKMWFTASARICRSMLLTGKRAELAGCVEELIAVEPEDRCAAARSLAQLAAGLLGTGMTELGSATLRRAEALATGLDDRLLSASLLDAQGIEAALVLGFLEQARNAHLAAAAELTSVGHQRRALGARTNAAGAAGLIGLFDLAVAELEQVIAAYLATVPDKIWQDRTLLGDPLRRAKRLDEALAVSRAAQEEAASHGDAVYADVAGATVVLTLLDQGDLNGARELLASDPELPSRCADRRGHLARARLRFLEGDMTGVLAAVEPVLAGLGRPIDAYDVGLHVLRIEALHALDRHGEAVAALRPIVAVVLDDSFKLESHEARQAFLGNVEENARVLALAGQWGVATEPAAQ